MGKNKISTSRRPSATIENGHINPKPPTFGTIIDETGRMSQVGLDTFPNQHLYGKTLNVPDPTTILHTLPAVTPAAPLNPPRPAIMSTPKTSMISVKNPSTAVHLSPTETRPLLLVTTDQQQNQPQTTTVPNGRRLPLNGRLATMASTKSRQQPTIANNNQHQMINEITTQRSTPKKFTNNRPRTALFFTSGRMLIDRLFIL